MRITLALVLVAIMALPVAASYDDDERRLIEFIRTNNTGSSKDHWIVKDTLAGPTRTMLVFGYGDDGAACEEIVGALQREWPSAGYRCEADE